MRQQREPSACWRFCCLCPPLLVKISPPSSPTELRWSASITFIGLARNRPSSSHSPARPDAEAERINATTRAPEVLAELKAALGNDPARFARTVARPIVVERTL